MSTSTTGSEKITGTSHDFVTVPRLHHEMKLWLQSQVRLPQVKVGTSGNICVIWMSTPKGVEPRTAMSTTSINLALTSFSHTLGDDKRNAVQ